ncbi:PREDICTED: podocalyxin [Gekko japonicus]|uniref:Podocalyxin n=1 Tax=Gekko japonicus TaxID=146911 RepID=A0ABM1KGJ8_GEKJA|nr:PREDICTED: podocalyxin [Gekko japonicus]
MVGPSAPASISATTAKQAIPSATTPAQSSLSTGASVQKSTSKDGSTATSNAPATSPLGASTVKATSPAVASTATTAASRGAPPPTGVTVPLPVQATTLQQPPSTAGIASGPTPTGGTLAKSAANTSPAQKTTELPTEKPTASTAPSQGSSTTKQGSVAVDQNTAATTNRPSTGSSGGSGPPTTPAARQTTPSNVTRPATDTKPAGAPGSTVHPSAGQPSPSSPGVPVTTTATEARPPQEGSPPGGQGDHAGFLTQTQLLCEEEMPSAAQNVILSLSQAVPCENLIKSPLGEPLLDMVCKTLKPNFNRSRDHCLVRLASITGDPNAVAIVNVSVQINSVADELFESLKIKEGELKKLGVNVSYAGQYADMDSEDRFSMPLIITIVCMAASLLLVAAIYGCCHQRISQRKDQQRLTEELQTMENGYHDNPTLEVMETSSEMQEKKVNLNGELGDSWIVPMDSLTKEDQEEEEDTHL